MRGKMIKKGNEKWYENSVYNDDRNRRIRFCFGYACDTLFSQSFC